jgi:hypothetical protein
MCAALAARIHQSSSRVLPSHDCGILSDGLGTTPAAKVSQPAPGGLRRYSANHLLLTCVPKSVPRETAKKRRDGCCWVRRTATGSRPAGEAETARRLYRREHLAVRRLKGKRAQRIPMSEEMLTAPNQERAADFMTEPLSAGNTFRVLAIVGNLTCGCSAIDAESRLRLHRVTSVLNRLISEHASALAIRRGKGPEFTSRHYSSRCANDQNRLMLVEAHQLKQKGHFDGCHARLRYTLDESELVPHAADAERKLKSCQAQYNRPKPQSSVGCLGPEAYSARQVPRSDAATPMLGLRGSNATPSPHLPPSRSASGAPMPRRSPFIVAAHTENGNGLRYLLTVNRWPI